MIMYRNYKLLNNEQFISEFNKVDWNVLNNNVIGNQSSIVFERLVIGILDKFAPLKRRFVKGFNAPWITSEIKNLCRERDLVRKESIDNPILFTEYKKLRNKVNETIHRAKRKFYNDKYQNVKNSVDVWNVMNDMINFRSKTTTKICTIATANCDDITDDKLITNQFASEFIVSNSESNVSMCLNEMDAYEQAYNNNAEINLGKNEIVIGPLEVVNAIKYVKKGERDFK